MNTFLYIVFFPGRFRHVGIAFSDGSGIASIVFRVPIILRKIYFNLACKRVIDLKEKYGYVGKILKVDLTTGKIFNIPTERYADRFLGGIGLC